MIVMQIYSLGYGAQPRKQRRVWLKRFGLTLLLVGVVFLVHRLFIQNDSPSTQPGSNTAARPNDNGPRPETVAGRYLFNGTIVLARMVEKAAGNDLSQPFSQISTFEPEKYDAMTLDWECPTTEDIIPYQTQVDNLLFNCHKKWLPEVILKMGLQQLPISLRHTLEVGDLPFHHKDPFDRLLISQSRLERIPLLSPDKVFGKYGVETIW